MQIFFAESLRWIVECTLFLYAIGHGVGAAYRENNEAGSKCLCIMYWHNEWFSFDDHSFLNLRWLGKQFCYATLECCKIWEKAFKNRPSKIFIGCLSQILISPFLNTLPHMFLETLNQFSANLPFNCSIYFDIWRKALKGVKFNGNIAVKCGFWTISMETLQWNVVFEPFQWEQWSEMWFLNHFKECEKMLCLFF